MEFTISESKRLQGNIYLRCSACNKLSKLFSETQNSIEVCFSEYDSEITISCECGNKLGLHFRQEDDSDFRNHRIDKVLNNI
jgi:hypothetical protein